MRPAALALRIVAAPLIVSDLVLMKVTSPS